MTLKPTLRNGFILLALASLAYAQNGYTQGDGWSNGDNSGAAGTTTIANGNGATSTNINGNNNNGNNNDDNNHGSDGLGPPTYAEADFYNKHRQYIIVLHAVLACFAFGFFFPVGGILIRVGNFRGLWIAHAACQLIGYIGFVAAAVLGVYIARHLEVMNHAHPILGLFLVFLLAFQPFLGLLHHFAFKKHGRRVFWSYAHVWLGRVAITIGIANGGLGLQLSLETGVHPPSLETCIAYAAAAGFFWLVYVISAMYGAHRRSREAAIKEYA